MISKWKCPGRRTSPSWLDGHWEIFTVDSNSNFVHSSAKTSRCDFVFRLRLYFLSEQKLFVIKKQHKFVIKSERKVCNEKNKQRNSTKTSEFLFAKLNEWMKNQKLVFVQTDAFIRSCNRRWISFFVRVSMIGKKKSIETPQWDFVSQERKPIDVSQKIHTTKKLSTVNYCWTRKKKSVALKSSIYGGNKLSHFYHIFLWLLYRVGRGSNPMYKCKISSANPRTIHRC